MTQPYLKNLPTPLSRLWRPMWLISLGLHGLLLIMPISSPESSNSSEKQQELVSLIQLKPSPSPSSKPVAPKPKATASPTPIRPVVPRPPTPVAAPIVPTPVPAVTPVETAKEAPAPPKPTPSPTPTPSPLADVVVQDPIPDVPQLGTSEIAGVPVDSTWQKVEAPDEVLSEANMFMQSNGQLHPDIVGQIAQVPGKNPDQVFEEFFSSKLDAKFQVEPSGTYVPGGGLYKLTTEERSQPLYLALAPTKDGTGTVVTIWNNFPSPLE